MQQCWVESPKQRPTFSKLRAKFDSLISTQKDHMPYIDLEIDSLKPHYLTIPTDHEEDKGHSGEANGVSDFPREVDTLGYDYMRPLFDNSHETMQRSNNAYVETPTGPYAAMFPDSLNSSIDLSLASIDQPASQASSSLADPMWLL